MGREYCNMCHMIGGIVFCDYYDYGFAKCSEVTRCPDGLDDEDDDIDYDDEE